MAITIPWSVHLHHFRGFTFVCLHPNPHLILSVYQYDTAIPKRNEPSLISMARRGMPWLFPGFQLIQKNSLFSLVLLRRYFFLYNGLTFPFNWSLCSEICCQTRLWLKASLRNFILKNGLGLRGCFTAIERTLHNQEVVGLNPTGCRLFSSSSIFFYFPSLVECP